MKNIYLLFAVIVSFTMLVSCKDAEKKYTEAVYFKMDGDQLERPKDYRTWVFVGAPVTPNELNGGKAAFPEFHNVYIDPVSYKHWMKTGTWREGTILVKELVSVGAKAGASGNGYFQGQFIGLEVTVKSSEYFPNEPGNWSYFSFTNSEEGTLKDMAKAFETSQCNACHAANAKDDFVFTQYYPVLNTSKAIGEGIVPENDPKREMPAMGQILGQ